MSVHPENIPRDTCGISFLFWTPCHPVSTVHLFSIPSVRSYSHYDHEVNGYHCIVSIRSFLSSNIRSNAKQNLADLHWLPVRQESITRLHYWHSSQQRHMDPPTYPTYFNSERHHVISAPATIVCFTDVFGSRAFCHDDPTLFGTHCQLISAIISTTCFYLVLNAASKRISINFHSRPSHKRCPHLRFVSLSWHMARHQLQV